MKHLHPASAIIDIKKCKNLKRVPAYDSYPSVLTDKRRMSVKRIKIIKFFESDMLIESDNLIRQVINYKDFHPKSVELLYNLYKFFSTGVHGNELFVSGTKIPKVIQDSDFIDGLENPISAAIIGYHGVFKIEFDDKKLYTYATIVNVCDS